MNRKRLGAVLFSALATAAVMALGSTAVSAQTQTISIVPVGHTGPTANCNSSSASYIWTGTGYGNFSVTINNYVVTSLGIELTRTMAVPTISAGSYDAFAVGYDGHDGRRADSPQPDERYFVKFWDGLPDAVGAAVVGTTSATLDVPDPSNADEATWSGSIGQVVLSADAIYIQAVHAITGGWSPNSVQPICLGLTPLDVPTESTTTTTTTTTTTVAPTTTTVAPTTTTVAPTTTTVAPPTTTIPFDVLPTTTVAPPTTTTVRTEVLPAVEVAKPAAAVSGDPTFTG